MEREYALSRLGKVHVAIIYAAKEVRFIPGREPHHNLCEVESVRLTVMRRGAHELLLMTATSEGQLPRQTHHLPYLTGRKLQILGCRRKKVGNSKRRGCTWPRATCSAYKRLARGRVIRGMRVRGTVCGVGWSHDSC